MFSRLIQFLQQRKPITARKTPRRPKAGSVILRVEELERRILQPGRWDLCTIFDVNFVPKKHDGQELRDGMYWLAARLYSESCLMQRRQPFFDALWHEREEGVSAT